jgi:A/G-specific adenine glycosylase
MNSLSHKKIFTRSLLLWNKKSNTRQMPWKGIDDPYKIWLSEIMLQQTRVEQGTAYYNRFIEKFPTVDKLALAEDDEVFKMWEGLGYYSRCKNLMATAKIIAFEYNGIFPNKYDDILKLKGIGPYTAAAIASFAFKLPYAVVDGNVTRLISRFFGIEKPIDTNDGKKYFAELAQSLLHAEDPATYNQAIMDFGATVCKPQQPLCEICILQQKCVAYAEGLTKMLPVKEKKLLKRNRYFYYIIVEQQEKIFVRKRTEKDIWQNLWEFILVETDEKLPAEAFIKREEFKQLFGGFIVSIQTSVFYKQQLTHQTIEGLFLYVTVDATFNNEHYTALEKAEIKMLAFPKFITGFLEKKEKLKIIAV